MRQRIKTEKTTPKIEAKDTKEVIVLLDVNEVNAKLKEGWILMGSGMSHIDTAGYNAKPTFILAKM